LELVLANHVQFGQRFADWTIRREQEAVSPVAVIRRFRHGTQGGIFLVWLGGRHNIIAQVIGDMDSTLVSFHN
jgi:hypothetical protein